MAHSSAPPLFVGGPLHGHEVLVPLEARTLEQIQSNARPKLPAQYTDLPTGTVYVHNEVTSQGDDPRVRDTYLVRELIGNASAAHQYFMDALARWWFSRGRPATPAAQPAAEEPAGWFFAECDGCEVPPLRKQFKTALERARWAMEHIALTGHELKYYFVPQHTTDNGHNRAAQ